MPDAVVLQMPGSELDLFSAEPSIDPLRGMNGRQKAAVLVLQLGREESIRVFCFR